MIQKKNSQQRKKKNNPKRNQKMNNKIMKTLVVQKNQTITKVVKTKKDKPQSHRYQYKNKEKYCSICNTPLQKSIADRQEKLKVVYDVIMFFLVTP
jgi:hypothetical protein